MKLDKIVGILEKLCDLLLDCNLRRIEKVFPVIVKLQIRDLDSDWCSEVKTGDMIGVKCEVDPDWDMKSNDDRCEWLFEPIDYSDMRYRMTEGFLDLKWERLGDSEA
jgi:hypothetical protein